MSSHSTDGVIVSVIVPVYNPGPYIETSIDSLLKQSLPANRYELIFVDDGSTDETPARLDRLAATERNVKVFHEPASGWAGRPRNVGIDNAVGRYVFFCDQDDWLAPEALERMAAFADEAGADVLIGKMIGHGRGVPKVLFTSNDPDATLWSRPLMSSLTPHKLFRRSFLDAHSLRFPEGKRRLEDHVFVVTAYFLAAKIAVLSDYDCYHHLRRDDQSNAAFGTVDPTAYYGYVREVIDIIERYTEPGPKRDAVLDRSFMQEILGQVSRRRSVTERDESYRQGMFDEARRLMHERFPRDFADRHGWTAKLRAALVWDGRADLLADQIERAGSLALHTELSSIEWAADHWRGQVAADLRFADGTPLRLVPADDGRWAVDPRLLPAELAGQFPIDGEEVLKASGRVNVEERTSGDEWPAPATFAAELEPIAGDRDQAVRLVLRGTVDLDVVTMAAGDPLADGIWDVRLHMSYLGIRLNARVNGAAAAGSLPATAVVGPRPATASAYLTAGHDTLALDMGQRRYSLVESMLARPIGPLSVGHGEIEIPIHIEVAANAAARPLRLELLGGDTVLGHCNATVVAGDERAVIRAKSRPMSDVTSRPFVLGPARYTVTAKSRRRDEPAALGTVDVDGSGDIVAASFETADRETVQPRPSAYDENPPALLRIAQYLRAAARRAAGRARR